jgi:hypothetical protein
LPLPIRVGAGYGAQGGRDEADLINKISFFTPKQHKLLGGDYFEKSFYKNSFRIYCDTAVLYGCCMGLCRIGSGFDQ